MDRNTFLKLTTFSVGAITTIPLYPINPFIRKGYQSARPPKAERKFISKRIEEVIELVKKDIPNPDLAILFENCYPNTLDTTVNFKIENGIPDTFVITGDIPAMWLRDSTAQVWPYLPYANEDPDLKMLLQGLIKRQAELIRIDPYANAFNDGPTGSQWESDLTDMKPELHERKWEIDSLCYPIRLAYNYYQKTQDLSVFDEKWLVTANYIIKTFKEQQRKEGHGPYSFMRSSPISTDTLPGRGYGNPIKANGLICSSFRPSDDATIFPFLIPSNFFAEKSMRQMAIIAEEVYQDRSFAREIISLADEVEEALKVHAVYEHPEFGKILPFEIDGFSNKLLMDDANIPSIMSLPYLDCIDVDNPLYQNSRRFILSRDNPWYFEGKAAKGIGGPHVGVDMIWPMSIIMQAMTSRDEEEIVDCIRTLIATHAGTGFMHETFHKDDPDNYTRSWFAWANTLFGELILKIHSEKKHLLKII